MANLFWKTENAEWANYKKKRLPVKLVCFEQYKRIAEAFSNSSTRFINSRRGGY